MGNMNINPSGIASQSLTGDLLKPAQSNKIQASQRIQSPEETDKNLKKLGDFLKSSLDELRKITFGETVAPALVNASSRSVIGFSSSDSARVVADAEDFLRAHEKEAHIS